MMRPLAILILALPASAQLTVVSVEPLLHEIAADPRAIVRVHFDRPVDPSTLPPSIGSLMIGGSIQGAIGGTIGYENGGATLRFSPAGAYRAGEDVTVHLTHDLRGTDGTPMRRVGFTWRFRVATRAAPMTFDVVDDQDMRDASGAISRVYGASSGDLDSDGYPDFAVTCEDSNDLRVLLGRGDATGRSHPFLPAYALQLVPSPSAICDVDGDGLLDDVVANINSSTISVARGRGDGTFHPRVDWPSGLSPMGLAMLDADGDGDLDAVTANAASDDLTCMLNDGSGGFSAPSHFASGGNGEIAVAAEDMNEDGALDLVVATLQSQRIQVLLASGPASWTHVTSIYCGGSVWGLQLGDIDHDGHLDVAAANGSSNSGALLFGNGLGGLSAPFMMASGNLTLASDLGDLDGDGDLDLVFSCYLSGWWRMYRNDGPAGMTFVRDIAALGNPACSILVDLDRDRDLDIVLFDEVADRVLFLRNGSGPETMVCSGDGLDASCPCANAGAPGHGCANSGNALGAELTAQGSTSPDTLVLSAGGLQGNALALFVVGNALAAPIPVGDGLRCAGGSLVQFGGQISQAGAASFPLTSGQMISVESGTTSGSGAARYYQLYYRNAAAFCMNATFNATNGLVVVW